MPGIGYGKQIGIGKGLEAFGKNFLNTYLAMQQLGMKKEEMKRQMEIDKSLAEQRKLNKMMKEMQYEQMMKQLQEQNYKKEHIYIPWLKENLKDDPQWGSLSDEVWGKMGYGTLKRWYDRTKFGMEHAKDDDAIKWANWGLKDKQLAWGMVMDTERTGILPDDSKYIYYDKSVRDKVAKTVDRAKNLPTEEDFEKEKAKYEEVPGAEIEPGTVVLDKRKGKMRFRKEPEELANELVNNRTVKKWASEHYLGNGKWRPGTGREFGLNWGEEYGISWDLFRNIIEQTGLFPVEPTKKKYKKTEPEKEAVKGLTKEQDKEIREMVKRLRKAKATNEQIREAVMKKKKSYNK